MKQTDKAQQIDPLASLFWTRVYVIEFDVAACEFGTVHQDPKHKLKHGSSVAASRAAEASLATLKSDSTSPLVVERETLDVAPAIPGGQARVPRQRHEDFH